MNKRKKAPSSAARGARGGHLLGPPRGAPRTAKNAARVTKSHDTRTTTLTLMAECTVAEAISLKERLASLLDQPLPVTLDINSLQRIDTAGLQLLTAFVRERAGHGRAVEWQGTAPGLVTAAQILGLTSFLKLPA